MNALYFLVVFLSILSDQPRQGVPDEFCQLYSCSYGGIIRGDTSRRELALVFTGGDYADGGAHIQQVLNSLDVKSSFFFTGNFYRNPEFNEIIRNLRDDGHYLGAHSDRHLLYCDWMNRDSLLVTRKEFLNDLEANYEAMAKFGIARTDAGFFLPPYEWYNDSISKWTSEAGFQLVNFTPGTRSNADYTTPHMANYRASEEIFESIVEYELKDHAGLNGFILLIHIGTAPERSDKFYYKLEALVKWLHGKGYQLKRIDEMLRKH
jgi:peptidoglycan/xylan/chitin deacetylase (PgdA/CDA1 family)